MPAPSTDTPQPLVEHLRELRSRILWCTAVIALIAIALTPVAPELYTLVAQPLQKLMPENVSMIAIEVSSPFLTPFKLVLVSALFLAMPFLFYQGWAFAAPGMYKHERNFSILLLIGSIVLFYLGVLFAWYAVMPLAFAFFTSVAPAGVAVMTDIKHYLNFVLKVMFAFGIAFQMPVGVMVAVRTRLINVKRLSQMRPYVIVFCFFIGMLLTPPDILSQILLAIPAWFLFEIGLLLAYFYERRTKNGRDV